VTSRRARLLAGLVAAAIGGMLAAVEDPSIPTIATAVILGAALAGADRRPRATWLLATAALILAAPVGALSGAVILLVSAHAFTAGRREHGWAVIAAPLALLGASLANALVAQDDSVVPLLLLVAVGWGAGRALRERELVAAQLSDRARDLEQEREAFATMSVRYERARIASEMHDIVAHAISVMVVQASAGQRVAAQDPDLVAEAFAAIADAAKQAEQDVSRLVALLGDDQAIHPAPDLALVEELVARAVGSGLDVNLRLEVDRDGLPAAVVEVAYRVIQEGLTNALRYAAGAAVAVLVRSDREALVIEVENTAAPREDVLVGAGTGNGLLGLRERVGELSGRLDAGRTPDGGWRLAARLPGRVAARPLG
jgi:signal transduction histidine kinase